MSNLGQLIEPRGTTVYGADPTEVVSITVSRPVPVTMIEPPPSIYGAEAGNGLARLKLESWKAKADAAHEQNLLAMAHNREQSVKLAVFLSGLGITGYSKRDERSRLRYPKTIHFEAGYIGDLARTFKTTDGYESYVLQYRSKSSELSRAEERHKNERKQLEAKRDQERKERAALVELGKMCAKYEVECETWSDMLDVLRSKCRYLDLAVGGYQTRCDWSDGPWAARNALDRFDPGSDADAAIVEEWSRCLEDFEDGRCFRDTEHSYDYLFGLVEPGLLADARVAMEHCDG